MTGKQKKQYGAQKAVMTVMEKHLVSWQGVTELQRKYDLFVKNLKKIENALRVLEKEVEPLKEKRAASRKALVEQLFPVTSVMGVYAYDTGDKKMSKLVNHKFSDLEEMKPGALDRYSLKVLNKADQLLSQTKEGSKKTPDRLISEYGLGEGHVASAKSAREASVASSAAVKQLLADREESSGTLTKAIRENNKLLKRKIDRMIHLFRDTVPSFYTEYQEARGAGGKAPVKVRKPGAAKAGPTAAGISPEKETKKPAQKGAAVTGSKTTRKPPVRKGQGTGRTGTARNASPTRKTQGAPAGKKP